jgi:hypothetical protein
MKTLEDMIQETVRDKYPPVKSVRVPDPVRRGNNWWHLLWLPPVLVISVCAFLGQIPEPPTTSGDAGRSENDKLSHDVYQLLQFGTRAKASGVASDYGYNVAWNGDHLDLYARDRDAATRLAKLACEQTFVGDQTLDLNRWNVHVLLTDGSIGAECHIHAHETTK